MQMTIISPEGVLADQQVERVTLPGVAGSFTVLNNHAPMIAGLSGGTVRYTAEGSEQEIEIPGGVAEISHNKISILTH